MQVMQGNESKTGIDDIANRELIESQLKILLEGWIPRIPIGRVHAFAERLNQVAEEFILSFPKESNDAIDRRSKMVMWERIKTANAKKILVAAEFFKKGLTSHSLKSNTEPVKSELEKLIERVKRLASHPGAKAQLARFLKVAPARVTEWLSDDPETRKEPGGHYTLELLKWVRQNERK